MICTAKILGFIMFLLGAGMVLGVILPCPIFIAVVLIVIGAVAIFK